MATTDLSGKVIVVTGAGSGIGRATCIALARANAVVIACDIDIGRAEATLRELENIRNSASDHHEAYAVNVASAERCADTLNEFASRHTLSGLFNCAGINPTSLPLTGVTDEYFDLLVNTNLRGTFNMTRAVIPFFTPDTGCSIVNVSSSAGIRASAGFAIYNMTKFGIIGFSKSMALELGPQGIRCNVVAPGPIDTPTNAAVVAGKEAIKRQEGNVAMGRLGRPEEVADVVTFLFGDGARFMNGSVVEVNGGL